MISKAKLGELYTLANASEYNSFDPKPVREALEEYHELWVKLGWNGQDTLWIKPAPGKERYAFLMAKSLGSDECDAYELSEELEDHRENLKRDRYAAEEKNVEILESFKSGRVIRVWWD